MSTATLLTRIMVWFQACLQATNDVDGKNQVLCWPKGNSILPSCQLCGHESHIESQDSPSHGSIRWIHETVKEC